MSKSIRKRYCRYNQQQMLLLPLLLLIIEMKEKVPVLEAARQQLSVNEKHLKTIESYMDMSEDPCEDFYGYACGSWAQYHKSEHYAETTGLIDHKVNKKLIQYLEETYAPPAGGAEGEEGGTSSFYDKVWTYYKSCKREKKRKLIRYLQIVRPAGHVNWPLLEELKATREAWQKENFNWFLTLAKLQRYSFTGTIIEYMLQQNERNVSVSQNQEIHTQAYAIHLDKPTLYGNNKLPEKIVIAALLLQLGISKQRAVEVVKDLIAFEAEIEQLLAIEDEYGLIEMTIYELELDMPEIPWSKYLTMILGYEPSAEYTLLMRNREYFRALPKLMQQFSADVVCNYIMIKLFYFVVLDGSSAFSKIDCMMDVRSKMDIGMNFIYYENFYRHKASVYNAEVNRIFEILRGELLHKLRANTLNLSAAELEFLSEKLQKLRINIGNLPRNVSSGFINRYYSDVQLLHRNYYHNHLALLQLRFLKEHALLKENYTQSSVDDFFFIADSDTARSSTPFYMINKNLIIVPFGILQTPMFHKNMLDVFKMSLFGFLLAHEVTHGFDATGVVIDFAGNPQGRGANITENKRFAAALKCMLQSNTESLDERIADIVGVRLAYDAFFGASGGANSSSTNASQLHQPNFTKISLKRLFFLNMAQFFCGNLKAEFAEHDSDDVRLQETLLNFAPFAEEFKCNLGNVMHPEKKCQLW